MNKTKEEILKKEYSVFASDSSWEGFKKSQTYFHASEAMDEWAKQQAIAFERWKVQEGWLPEEGSDVYRSYIHNSEPTLPELYDLFIEHQKQQQ